MLSLTEFTRTTERRRFAPTNCLVLPLLALLASAASPAAYAADQPTVIPVGETAPTPLASPLPSPGPAPTSDDWSLHFQSTLVTQYHPDFPALYSGQNSMSTSELPATSITATAFLGRKLWSGGEVFADPELFGGSGLGQTLGIAGFPNGEIYRVDDPRLQWSIARVFYRQFIGLGGEQERLESDQNQLPESVDVKRVTVVVGKFALNDFLDNNAYTHDPRTQFLNWVLMDYGAWDYAADTRGYSWGVFLEVNQPDWALRFASVLEPLYANQMQMDLNYPTERGDNLEFEYRYAPYGHKGVARLLAYDNRALMANYRDTIAAAQATGTTPDVTQFRPLATKFGFGLGFEQELTPDLGAFLKASWDNGTTETWAFTEVDRSLVFGGVLKGTRWTRPDDAVGLAFVINGLSRDHADYLGDGGYGFLIGDGALNYAPEQILETYYLFQFNKELALTGDYQFVNHPAYNQDRGPISILGARVHYAF